MGLSIPDLIICSIVLGCLGVICILTNFLRLLLGGEDSVLTLSQLIELHSIEYGWLLKLLVNCFGYSCIIVPGILIYRYTKSIDYFERNEYGFLSKSTRLCIQGRGTVSDDLPIRNSNIQTNLPTVNRTPMRECILLSYCFFGLMISYLTWGLLQEKIMTQTYSHINGKTTSVYKDSQFLVFTNRCLAFIISFGYLFAINKLRQRVPLFKYSFASFSNIMSAWFQYEALKFVNFPTQILAKSCKIIPVMMMGKVISRTKYEFYEYVTAVLISMGMVFFLMGSADGTHKSSITTMTGVLLLTLYMLFDSFTSNWQADLFKTYSMSSMQMMCGVNLFSTLFTAASLTIQGGFMDSLSFAMEHPKFIVDCFILSISSAIGQLFIFYTIATFGPVVFAIIGTVRQAVAILLSCLVYKHYISNVGIFGIVVVFSAIMLRVYCNQRLKSLRRRAAEATKIGV